MDNEFPNYAVYDKSMGHVMAYIQIQDDGKLKVQIATDIGSWFVADDLSDAAWVFGTSDFKVPPSRCYRTDNSAPSPNPR